MKVQFSRPTIGEEEIKAVVKVMQSGWIAYGKVSEEFERLFAEFTGAKYAVFTGGCTAALNISLLNLGIGRGDKVIVPSFTFTATASVVTELGAIPVFADIRPDTLTIDQEDCRKIKGAKAMIVMDYGGNIADRPDFEIPVIRDSAHRIGKYLGDYAQCHSFYATKNMTSGHGGMLVTDDYKLYREAKIMINDGITRSIADRYNGKPSYKVKYAIGGKDNIDILAAIGIEQLKKVHRMHERRAEIVERYNRAFNLENKGLHIYPFLTDKRDKFIKYLNERGIKVSIFYFPLHKQPAYRKYSHRPLPITEWASEKCVALPIYPTMTDPEIDYVIETVQNWSG